jgi:hypothetical protein
MWNQSSLRQVFVVLLAAAGSSSTLQQVKNSGSYLGHLVTDVICVINVIRRSHVQMDNGSRFIHNDLARRRGVGSHPALPPSSTHDRPMGRGIRFIRSGMLASRVPSEPFMRSRVLDRVFISPRK